MSNRRDFLRRASGGFGAIALAGMLAEESRASSELPLAPNRLTSPREPIA